nr:MAG TPA: hypothetical protein [Bacteriophage sp.]
MGKLAVVKIIGTSYLTTHLRHVYETHFYHEHVACC